MKREQAKGTMTRRELIKRGGTAGAGALLAVAGAPLGRGIATVAEASDSQKSVRWGFLVDLRRCIGCEACTVACKTENDVRLGVFRTSVKDYDHGTYPKAKRSFFPWLCNHCEKPACLEDCPVDEIEALFVWPDGKEETYDKRATYQRPDGLVLIDQERCVGCGACVELCPYKVRYQDPVKEGELGGKADKCTMCVHRLDRGVVPACANTCQGGARIAGNLNDPKSEISEILRTEKAEPLHPDFGTDPRCFYIGLDQEAYDKGRDVR